MAEHQPANWNLFCIIVNEKSPFSVEIQPNATVDALKKAIKKEKQPEFDDFAADRLTLFLVNLPDEDDLAEIVKQPLTIKLPTALRATEQVRDLLPNGPTKGIVYILVQIPDTTRKRRNREDTAADDDDIEHQRGHLHIMAPLHDRLSEDDADSEPASKRRKGPPRSMQRLAAEASALHAKAWDQKWPQSEGTIHETEIINSRHTPMQPGASDVHAKAWSKPWPDPEDTIDKTEIYHDKTSSVEDDDDDNDDNDDNDEDTIDKTEIYHDKTSSVDDDEDVGGPLADKLVVLPQFNYQYLKEIRSLKSILGIKPGKAEEDFLVVREEYEILRKTLVKDLENYDSFVVTGHPGIGKSTFLLYLLLYRLEKKRPTAVQFDAEYYFIFDEHGATVNTLSNRDPRLGKCWALADSNQKVSQPCAAFEAAELTVLASSPKPERWREWEKQTGARRIISDLPSVPEIAAIAKELAKRRTQLGKQALYDPSSTPSLVRKWGPSTRNILNTMKYTALRQYDKIENAAKQAATTLSKNPSTLGADIELIEGHDGSSLIFLRRTLKGDVDRGQRFIPTPHLRAIFEEQRKNMSDRAFFDLFCVLSSHSLTRSTAGWGHEKLTHERLLNGEGLTIFQGSTKKHMRPSNLLIGTLNGLKKVDATDSFYWIPSVVNFPGVDSVLGDTDGAVYTIQATIAEGHTGPKEGIKKVWRQFRPEVRTTRTWHFVIVTDSKEAAKAYEGQFSLELSNLRLGKTQVKVQFWTCALRS